MSITFYPPVMFFDLSAMPDDFTKVSDDLTVEFAGHQPNPHYGVPGEFIFQVMQADEQTPLTQESRVLSPVDSPYQKAAVRLIPVQERNERRMWEGATLKVAFVSRCQPDWEWCRDAGGPSVEALQVRMHYEAGTAQTIERNDAACIEATTNIASSGSSEVRPGDTFEMRVTMKNTGTQTWRPGIHALVPETDGHAMWGVSRIALDREVRPGESHTFLAEGFAPAAAGVRCIETGSGLGWFSCAMSWKLEEYPEKFGHVCSHAVLFKTDHFDF